MTQKKGPKIHLSNSVFAYGGTAISLPKDWNGEFHGTDNTFLGNRRDFEFRDEEPTLEIPKGVIDEVMRIYHEAIAQNASKEVAVIEVTKSDTVKSFFTRHGFDATQLAVSVTALIAQLLGR